MEGSTALLIDGKRLEQVWSFRAPDPKYNFVVQKSTPALDKERVYYGTDSGTFYALEQETGHVVWSQKTRDVSEEKGIFSSPVVYNGIVYFGSMTAPSMHWSARPEKMLDV